MKIETRNQLLGIIAGTAIALGVNLLPGLSDQVKTWVILVAILAILIIFKHPGVKKAATKKTRD